MRNDGFASGMAAGLALGAVIVLALTPSTRRPMIQGATQLGGRMRKMMGNKGMMKGLMGSMMGGGGGMPPDMASLMGGGGGGMGGGKLPKIRKRPRGFRF